MMLAWLAQQIGGNQTGASEPCPDATRGKLLADRGPNRRAIRALEAVLPPHNAVATFERCECQAN
jgi:hypothetical protein